MTTSPEQLAKRLHQQGLLGPRGNTTITAPNKANGMIGNRDHAQIWVGTFGVPSKIYKSMKIETLNAAYNSQKYLGSMLYNRAKAMRTATAWQFYDDALNEGFAAPARGDDGARPTGGAETETETGDAGADGQASERETLAADQESERETLAANATSNAGLGNGAIPAPVPASGDALAQLSAAIAALFAQQATASANALDEDRVKELIAEHVNTPRAITVTVADKATGARRDFGVQHKKFPLLFKLANVHNKEGNKLNLWLAGPAGGGKTTSAKMLAKALGVPFFFTGAIDSEYKLLGFIDAHGKVVSKPFKEAYRQPSVFLFDEVDRSYPGALMAFQAALANGTCDFPDGPLTRHPDCLILAAGNTAGMGGDDMYNTVAKLDAAFTDRFQPLMWDYDEALERVIAENDGWVAYVQSCRERARKNGVRVVISPRASYDGAALLADGVDLETVKLLAVKKGMSDEQWGEVK